MIKAHFLHTHHFEMDRKLLESGYFLLTDLQKDWASGAMVVALYGNSELLFALYRQILTKFRKAEIFQKN